MKRFRFSLGRSLRRAAGRMERVPYLNQVLGCVLLCIAGFLLAGSGLLGSCVPLALAPVCALDFGAGSICAFVGAAGGYLFFWGASAALEPIAAGFLLLAGSCMFRDLPSAQKKALFPPAAAGVYALIGIVFLVDAGGARSRILQLLVRTLLLAVTLPCLFRALEGSRTDRLLCGVLSLASLCRYPILPGVPLALVPASAAVLLSSGGAWALPAAALCGLCIDAVAMPALSQTACFCLAALICARSGPNRLARAAVFDGIYLACVLFRGGRDGGMLLAAMAGSLVYLLLPAAVRRMFWPEPARPGCAPQTLLEASDIFRALGSLPARETAEQGLSAAVFDDASEKVCADCDRKPLCWKEHENETYRAFTLAAQRMVRRGCARQEDFPPQFLTRCTCADDLISAINGSMQKRREQLRTDAQRRELHRIACSFSGAISALLHTLSEEPEHEGRSAFRMDLSIRAQSAHARYPCADRTESFRCGMWEYLLLCDGMGTGPEAEREAASSAELLRRLLCLGLDAGDALQLLNSFYILRGSGVFSTVDLLQISLASGEGVLYKWGAAPSFLKRGEEVIKIGTAMMPPGLGVGEAHKAECIRLSLRRGEQLVLTSDGVEAERCEQYLRICGMLSPRELAAGVAACVSSQEPDDRTAAVVQLSPVLSHSKHIIKRVQSMSKSGAASHI